MVPRMRVGEIIEVLVTAVEPGYIKVNYNGLDSILQLTELSWRAGPIDSSEIVKLGEKVKVKVIAVAGDAYSISLKQMFPNPWLSGPKIGEVHSSPMVLATDYGYFFEVAFFCWGLLLRENSSKDYRLGEAELVEVVSVDSVRQKVELHVAKKP